MQFYDLSSEVQSSTSDDDSSCTSSTPCLSARAIPELDVLCTESEDLPVVSTDEDEATEPLDGPVDAGDEGAHPSPAR